MKHQETRQDETRKSEQAKQDETRKSQEQTGELKQDDLKNVNGGGILGDDNSSLTGILQGSVGITNKDDNGDEESTRLDLGLGSMLDSKND